ncbi:MAG: MmgE/PrpD family protein [Candidatus Electryonea clarkiae]|nr:MmgE/PrpD family protein [Candidatus Electryonea clarkiae]MDP8288079.1 MmgE/PrpD family protein [Candidatus Electryonea clarkiae]
MLTISQQISDWAAQVKFEDMSADAVQMSKVILYDSIGCAFGGFKTHDVTIMREYSEEKGGIEEATVIGSGKKLPVVDAALLNALMVRALDFNDIYWKQDPSHPSDIIPGPMALGERLGKTGKDLLLAIAVGHEIEMRLCEAGFPGIRERKWHHATLTAFAAPVACGVIMGLNSEQIAHAIGISGSRHATLGAVTAGKLTMMKNTVDPMATQSGVLAAELAARGYEGPEHIIDGKEGLFDCYGPDWKGEILTDGLGESWRIPQCGLKAFPIEALSHAPLTALIELLIDHDLQPDEIKEVQIKTIARAADILSDPAKYNPQTRESADHSLPYCMSVAIVDRKVIPQSFTEDKIFNPVIREQLNKIKVVAEPDYEPLFPAKQPNEITVTTTDGRSLVNYIEYPMGDPRHPISEQGLDDKFESLADGVIDKYRQKKIKEFVFNLDRAGAVPELFELLIKNV